jgi:hypothetical protein
MIPGTKLGKLTCQGGGSQLGNNNALKNAQLSMAISLLQPPLAANAGPDGKAGWPGDAAAEQSARAWARAASACWGGRL